MFDFSFKEAYYAIKYEDFHYGWEDPKDRSETGVYSFYYDGYMLGFNCYFFYFGWWNKYCCQCDRCKNEKK